MKTHILLLTGLFLTTAAGAAPSWPHEGSDIEPDASVRWGELENDLRYVVMPHGDPPGRLSLRLYVDAGSVMEEDDQQGVAHFLEHMAFNGTTHFPAGEMVEYFQRLGMAFGADTNAHTSFKETVYKLDLPNSEEGLLRETMQLIRDYADGMLFLEEEIEKERGVILSEKLARDSEDYRSYVEKMKFNLPDSLLSRRLPIGIEETISKAPRERFLDFYEKYYVPQRMVLVAVGDVKPELIEELVREFLGPIEAAAAPAPDPSLGKVAPRGVVAHFHPEVKASASWIALEVMTPFARGADRRERRAEELRLYLANRMLSRRFEILLKQDGAPFIYGRASSDDMLDFVTEGSVQLAAKPEDWKAALFTAEQELRRALEHGFTAAELEEAKANVRQAYERKAATVDTRKSRDIADSIVERIGEGRVFTNPVDDLARVGEELDRVTVEECLESLRGLWGAGEMQVFLSGNIDIPKEEGAAIALAAYNESRAVEVAAPVEEAVAEFAYAGEREAGEIASRNRVEDLEVTQVAFANGVRLNVKQTDFEIETIRISVRFGGGLLTEPREAPGLATFVGETFQEGGLEAHSEDELKRIFAGRTIEIAFGVEDDAFQLSGRTNAADLADGLRLLSAYLTAPGFREEAAGQFRRGLESTYNELRNTPMGVMQNEVERFIHRGDPRFGYPDQEVLASRTQEEARPWLGPAHKEGYLEITVVGDFEGEEDVVAAIAELFGSLPSRDGTKPAYAEERRLSFPEAGEARTFPYVSEIPKSAILVYWKSTDMWDIERSRRMNLLTSVMRDRLRLKIREELGEAYSPYARSAMSDVFTGYGYVVAMVESDRDKAEKIASILSDIAEELRVHGTSEDELERARKPLMNMLEEYRRNNSYWMESVLASSQEHPVRLDWARSIVDDYGTASVEEVNALAAEYLGAAKALKVLIVSEDAKDSG